MAHKKSHVVLDRSLRDLRGNVQPFGNELILLAGDFRQILPVISRSSPADEINAYLKYSTLWQHVRTLQSYEYACPATSISRGILTKVTKHWERKAASR
jgi:PIF1 helicase.